MKYNSVTLMYPLHLCIRYTYVSVTLIRNHKNLPEYLFPKQA